MIEMLGEVVSFPFQKFKQIHHGLCCDVVQKECWTNLCPLPRDPSPLCYLAREGAGCFVFRGKITLHHHFMANRWGNNGNSDKFYFLGLQNHCRC